MNEYYQPLYLITKTTLDLNRYWIRWCSWTNFCECTKRNQCKQIYQTKRFFLL